MKFFCRLATKRPHTQVLHLQFAYIRLLTDLSQAKSVLVRSECTRDDDNRQFVANSLYRLFGKVRWRFSFSNKSSRHAPADLQFNSYRITNYICLPSLPIRMLSLFFHFIFDLIFGMRFRSHSSIFRFISNARSFICTIFNHDASCFCTCNLDSRIGLRGRNK